MTIPTSQQVQRLLQTYVDGGQGVSGDHFTCDLGSSGPFFGPPLITFLVHW